MNPKFYFHFSLFFALLISFAAFSQQSVISEKSLNPNNDYVIENWNSENGLPQNSINEIFQSSDGYLWLSTTNGIVRFDGVSFKTFNKYTPGLKDWFVDRFFEDSKKQIWMTFTSGNIAFFKNGVFTKVEIEEKEKIIDMGKVCESPSGQLFIGNNKKIFTLKNGKFRLLFDLKNDANFKNEYFRIKDLFFIKDELFICTTKGLYKYKEGKCIKIEGSPEDWIFEMKKGNDGTVFFRTTLSIYSYSNNKINLLYSFDKKQKKEEEILCYQIEKDGKIWVVTASGLFTIFNNKISLMHSDIGLSSDDLHSVYIDREENIWVGSKSRGLDKLKRKPIKTYSTYNGMLNESIGPIMLLNRDTILVSNYCKGILLLNKGLTKRDELLGSGKTDLGCFWSLLKDNQNNLWMGTYSSVIYRLNDRKLKKFIVNEDLAIFSLFQDSDSVIWAGTSNGLLKLINNKFVTYERERINSAVQNITEDSQGTMWLCSKQGLIEFKKGSIRKVYGQNEGFSSNNIRSVFEDKDATLWITTYGGGLHRFKDGKIFAFNMFTDLIDDFCSGLIADDHQNLWISTNQGIYSVGLNNLNAFADRKTNFLDVKHFGKRQGLLNTECNGGFQPSCIKQDDRIWFPTIDGVAEINTTAALSKHYDSLLLFEEILVDEKPHASENGIFTVSRDSKKIEIQYTCPSLSEPNNIFFEFKMEGLDEDWHKPTRSRKVSYYGLPPGKYSFHVRLYKDQNSSSPNKEINLTIDIPFPFWRTYLFYALVILIISAALFFFIFIRIKRIRKQELDKTAINKRYAQLELKALQAQMNPHFVFNCINNIKYFIKSGNASEANNYLGKFSNVIRMFLENSTSNSVSLSSEISLLENYIELEQMRFEYSFTYTVKQNINYNLESIKIPNMILQPYIENAIHHGLWPSTKKGELNLEFNTVNSEIEIIIDDNGIGREASMQRKSSQSHKSLGLSIISERVTLINYFENTDIFVETIDKFDENKNSVGTQIKLKFPLVID